MRRHRVWSDAVRPALDVFASHASRQRGRVWTHGARVRSLRAAASRRHLAGAAVALVMSLGLVGAVAWLEGWRVSVMTTPSMGTAAPVGSLVISRAIDGEHLHIGEMIAFHPPGRGVTTFIHRVVAIVAGPKGPTIRTRGDINGAADPWVLHRAEVVGRAVAEIPDAGFILQALPALATGIFLIVLLTSGLGSSVRAPARLLAGSGLCSALIWWYRPLVRVDLISQVIGGTRGWATLVATGVLPVRVHAVGGTTASLSPGRSGIVRLDHIGPHGLFRVLVTAHLSGGWWLLLAVGAIPVMLSLRRPPASLPPSPPASTPRAGVAPPAPQPPSAARTSTRRASNATISRCDGRSRRPHLPRRAKRLALLVPLIAVGAWSHACRRRRRSAVALWLPRV